MCAPLGHDESANLSDIEEAGARLAGIALRTPPPRIGVAQREITAAQLAQGNAMLQPVSNPFQGRLPGTPFDGPTVPLQLPFFAGRTDLLGSLLGGWETNAIVTAIRSACRRDGWRRARR